MARTKRIHVNRQRIAQNRKRPPDEHEPVVTVKTYNSNTYGFTAEIKGPSTLVYRPHQPLSCGARVWVETLSPVLVDGSILIE